MSPSCVTVETAICRRVSSPADPLQIGFRRPDTLITVASLVSLTGLAQLVRRIGIVLVLAILCRGSPALSEGLRLDFSRLDHPLATLEGVSLTVGGEGTPARLRVRRARIAGYVVEGVDLNCTSLKLAGAWVRCRGGQLDLPHILGHASLDIDFDAAGNRLVLELRTAEGERLELGLLPDGAFRVVLSRVDIARLSAIIPALEGFSTQGRLNGELSGRLADDSLPLVFELRLSEGGFIAPDGLNAAEGLGVDISGHVVRAPRGWQWSMMAEWDAGEAYVHPLYLEAGLNLALAGRLADDRIVLDSARLGVDGVQAIDLRASFGLSPFRLIEAAFAVADADLARLGSRYLMPVLAPALTDRVEMQGRVSAGAVYESESLVAIDLALSEVSVSLDGGMLGIGPVSGGLPWRAFESGLARLDVGAANWEALALGAFRIEAHVHGHAVDFEPIRVPVLDGSLVVSDLSLERRPEGWYGRGGARIEPLSLDRLTRAVGVPSLSGSLSAELPALVVQPGSLRLDGGLAISIFDGLVTVSRLELREPLGVAAYLSADLQARRLDLAKLTDAFAFGNITGRIDADVLGLELVRWRPVSFDAKVHSSPGRYPRRISQRAVQNIGALGGAGAALAIQRGFLGFFESFGYRELGWSCRLTEGVCFMAGIDDGGGAPDESFMIVRGGGIPSLDVIGYNRRVDWQELLTRLQAAIASNEAPVIQ